MKVLDLNAVISDSELMLRRVLGNDIRMTAIFASSLDPVRADARKIQQILLSLVAHSRRAMPAGGRITIETKNLRLNGEQDPTVRPGDYVMLAVSDTGTGMNEAALERVFEPLAKDDAQGDQFGLDLPMIPGIVRQFGGHIQVTSQLGQGATFKILLPRHDHSMPGRDALITPFATTNGHETILLVDDEDSVRSLLRTLLQSCGYTVLEAVHGAEAVHFAEKHPIDLVVADVVLPRLNGKALLERLLALHPQMKVLLVSGYPTDRLPHFGCKETEFAFLQKPFKCNVLADLVRQLLDSPEKRSRIA